VLVMPLTYPWREREKPLEGRAAGAHVGCCLFYVLCVVLFACLFYCFLANQLVEIDGGKVTSKQTLRNCK
jgi:hypothetical protein